MSKRSTGNGKEAPTGAPVRAAIYTRKSTSAGLEQEFNSLDAQRAACVAYIERQPGWILIEDRYDDGGFTGANTDRPAFQRLLTDVEARKIDVVVVYKVDRLSRSLLDFARVMERFGAVEASFVSVTQNFSTADAMGRLTLNMLMSFAEFEREIIGERTRDKISAARRKGKWTGGPVVLGYTLDSVRKVLVIASDEAKIVRLAFDLYLRTRSIGATAQRLNRMGYTQKQRVAKDGTPRGGHRWDKNAVHRILRNPLYTGRVPLHGDLFPGEHPAIISCETFQNVQDSLRGRSTGTGPRLSNRPEFLLTGILRCVPCGAGMTSSEARGRGGKRYRYYRCRRANNEGTPCPNGLVPAEKIEDAVVSYVREIARQGDIRDQILQELARDDGASTGLKAERDRLEEQLRSLEKDARKLIDAIPGANGRGKLLGARVAELEATMDGVRKEIAEVNARLSAMEAARTDAARVVELLAGFDGVWEALFPEERRELLRLIVHQVRIDGPRKELVVALHDLKVPGTVGGTPAEEPGRRIPA